jgi:uncharacterized membrane protein HdeD (DUF308 family)
MTTVTPPPPTLEGVRFEKEGPRVAQSAGVVTPETRGDATAWYVPLARAVPALVLAIVVTFSADHSAPLGLLTFGVFGVLAGAILVASALRLGATGIVRGITLAQGLVTVLAGVVSLALPAAGLPFFVFLLTAFAAITGFLELYLGLRSRGRDSSSRDWVFVGALTALLALLVLLVPPGFSQQFTGPDGVARELTASVVVVGALGAYWAILGVYLVIAGFSLKWSPTTREA